MTFTEANPCIDCGVVIVRARGQMGRLPKQCANCRDARSREMEEKEVRPVVAEETTPNEPSEPAFDALATIAALGLDYCVGSAFRFIAEYQDGDELENLTTARTYLNAAITARGGA